MFVLVLWCGVWLLCFSIGKAESFFYQLLLLYFAFCRAAYANQQWRWFWLFLQAVHTPVFARASYFSWWWWCRSWLKFLGLQMYPWTRKSLTRTLFIGWFVCVLESAWWQFAPHYYMGRVGCSLTDTRVTSWNHVWSRVLGKNNSHAAETIPKNPRSLWART